MSPRAADRLLSVAHHLLGLSTRLTVRPADRRLSTVPAAASLAAPLDGLWDTRRPAAPAEPAPSEALPALPPTPPPPQLPRARPLRARRGRGDLEDGRRPETDPLREGSPRGAVHDRTAALGTRRPADDAGPARAASAVGGPGRPVRPALPVVAAEVPGRRTAGGTTPAHRTVVRPSADLAGLAALLRADPTADGAVRRSGGQPGPGAAPAGGPAVSAARPAAPPTPSPAHPVVVDAGARQRPPRDADVEGTVGGGARAPADPDAAPGDLPPVGVPARRSLDVPLPSPRAGAPRPAPAAGPVASPVLPPGLSPGPPTAWDATPAAVDGAVDGAVDDLLDALADRLRLELRRHGISEA